MTRESDEKLAAEVVAAMRQAFGNQRARAAHAKGIVLEGRFAPTEEAGASVRVMGTAFATGQAAGVAAAEVAARGVVDPVAVRRALLQQGALIDGSAVR